MGQADIVPFPGDDELARAVAAQWLTEIEKAREAGQRHVVALSGGRIARKLFEVLSQSAAQDLLSHVEFFWADERCVPPGDPESNFRVADECLFRPARISPASIHRIRGELELHEAVAAATEELRRVSGANGRDSMPVFDLVLLGMGEDGHVASLFPAHHETAEDMESIYLSVENSPKPPPRRVSLGHGPIRAARQVWVLASGMGKEVALRNSLAPAGATPLARVIQGRSVTRVLTDIQ